MLLRALMLNPVLRVVAARVLGQYLTSDNVPYTVTWDAALKRLTFRVSNAVGFRTFVSSAAQAVMLSATKLGVFSIGSTGAAATPDATYPIPAVPTGYTLVARLANGDSLFQKAATGGTTQYVIQNFITGVTGASFTSSILGTPDKAYTTGDGFLLPIPQDNGIQSATAPWMYRLTTTAQLVVNYAVNSDGASPLGKVVNGALQPIPFTGVPRRLPRANTIFAFSVALSTEARSFSRRGVVYIPAQVTVDEVDVQKSNDPGQYANTTKASVSKATSIYYGLIRADMNGATFLPFSAYFNVRANVPSSDFGTYFVSFGAPPWIASNDTNSGIRGYNVDAMLNAVAGLYTSTDQGSGATSYVKTVATEDASVISEGFRSGPRLCGIPHLGMLMLYGGGQGSAYLDRGIVQVSLDGGRTWDQATCFNQRVGLDPSPFQGPPSIDPRLATPLFII